jgi:hypothetical protein
VGLKVQEEIVNAASGFAPKILAGTVTRQRALEEIASGSYDIIHIITHGREHVLQMTDGIIEEDMLEHAVCKANNVRVLFLNACRSAHAATSVYNRTNVAYSIGWSNDVSNPVALIWARLFFEALRMTPNDIGKAAQTANEVVVKSYHISADELPLVLNGRTRKVVEENERLRGELAEARQAAETGERLRGEVVQLREELAHMRQEQKRRDVVRLPLWMIVANLALVVLLLLNLLILTATH